MWKHEIIAYMEPQSFVYALRSSKSYSLVLDGNVWMRAKQEACLSYESVTSLGPGAGDRCMHDLIDRSSSCVEVFIAGLFQSLLTMVHKACCCGGMIPGVGSVWTSQQHLTAEGAGEAQADLGTKELLLRAA